MKKSYKARPDLQINQKTKIVLSAGVKTMKLFIAFNHNNVELCAPATKKLAEKEARDYRTAPGNGAQMILIKYRGYTIAAFLCGRKPYWINQGIKVPCKNVRSGKLQISKHIHQTKKEATL